MSVDLELEIKLTAYALGELEPEERAAIEKLLENDVTLRVFVAEIRETSAMLERELAAEEAPPSLEASQRANIEAAAQPAGASGSTGSSASASGATSVHSAGAVRRGERASASPRPIHRRRLHRVTAVAVLGVMVASTLVFVVTDRSSHDAMTVDRLETVTKTAHFEDTTISEPEPLSDTSLARVSNPSEQADPPSFWARVEDPIPTAELSGESYAEGYEENPFISAREEPLSTFSIDVDTASCSNIRRFLDAGQWPPKNAVRIEEMINYFDYRLPPPTDGRPFAVYADVTDAPWSTKNLLARIALSGRAIHRDQRPHANLVFLIDVSGSMAGPTRLDLVKKSIRLLLKELRSNDTVAIAVYAGASGLVLPPTPGSNHGELEAALDRLSAGGSTDGGSGIQLAYSVARRAFKHGGINRVILATDGDFNVGVTDRRALEDLITEEAKSGVFLTVLGYGMGNLKDATLETLADKGNGNYAYIDRLDEARKVLVDQLMGTLMTIAKDVKIQVELNADRVESYRLIGYENRTLAARDFDDDLKDAGEIGAGHQVTALYELVPAATTTSDGDRPLFSVQLRYKEPDENHSRLIERSVARSLGRYQGASEDFRFAAAVAAFGMILRRSPHKGSATLELVERWARGAVGPDHGGLRSEFVGLIGKARAIDTRAGYERTPLDANDVGRVIRGYRRSLTACLTETEPEWPGGKIEIAVRVEPNGRVSNVKVHRGVEKNPKLAACVAAKVREWRFPAFSGEAAEVLIPFVIDR